jgi:polyketide cyclase/dehydrase/lipid transport protein
MNTDQVWRGEYGIETSATAEVIWSILRDVPAWKTWNAGIEHIEIDGPFVAGTWFTMTPPGEDPLRSMLVDVSENAGFVDVTRVGDLAITVAHRIESLDAGRTRIVYAAEARGPQAAEIGPAVASDFPEVLAALVKLAEARTA